MKVEVAVKDQWDEKEEMEEVEMEKVAWFKGIQKLSWTLYYID